MNKRNKLLKKLLNIKVIIILVTLVIFTTGVIVYAAKGNGLPKDADTTIINGETNNDSKTKSGDITNYSGYNAIPIAMIRAITVPGNTAAEAEEYIKNNIDKIVGYGDEVKGHRYSYMWPWNTFSAQMKDLSQPAKDILKTFVRGGTPDWKDDESWWEILEYLHKMKHCSDATYDFAIKNKVWDAEQKMWVVDSGQGKQVVFTIALGVMSYQQVNDRVDVSTVSYLTDVSLIDGNAASKPYSSKEAAKSGIRSALMNGKGTAGGNAVYTTAFGLNKSGNAGGVGLLECFYTNYIETSDGNYYGRQYWGMGKKESSVVINFEVDASPQNEQKGLADGDKHEGISEVRFTASKSDITAITNAKDTIYKIKIVGRGTGEIANPKNSNGVHSVSDAKSIGYGALSKVQANSNTSFDTPENWKPVLEIEVTNKKLAEILTAGDGFQFKYLINDSKKKVEDYNKNEDDGLYYMIYTVKYDVSVTKVSGNGPSIGKTEPGRVSSIKTPHHDTVPGDLSTSFFSWVSGPVSTAGIKYEVDGTPSALKGTLGNGDKHRGTFLIKFSASDKDLSSIKDSDGAKYKITVKGVAPGTLVSPYGNKVSGTAVANSQKSTEFGTLTKTASSVSMTIDGSGRPTLVFTMTNEQLANMLENKEGVSIDYDVSDSLPLTSYVLENGLYYMYYTAKFDVTIERTTATGANISSIKPGGVSSISPKHHMTKMEADGTTKDRSASYVAWMSGDPKANITYEVDATPQEEGDSLGNGDKHKATFKVLLSGTSNDIEALRENADARYKVTITGQSASSANPSNQTSGVCVSYAPTGAESFADMSLTATKTGTTTPTVTLTMTGKQLADMIENEDGVELVYDVSDSLSLTSYHLKSGLYNMYFTAKFSVSVERTSSVGAAINQVKAGDVKRIEEKHHDTIPGDRAASFAHWYDGPPKPPAAYAIPWTYSTLENPTGYAEIVGNQAGYITKTDGTTVQAQDWNVHAGIPSTENVSVVIGGQTFLYDIAGWIVPSPKGEQFAYANKDEYNKDNGMELPTASVKRNILFEVIIDNWWGEDNYRCSLSCPGHTYTVSCTGSSSATCEGPQSACSICGWQIATPGHNPVPHGQDEEGNDIDIYCDHGVSASGSCPSNASGSATYSHTTGQWTVSGTNGSWTTTPGTLNANTQAYEGGTAVFNCSHCGGTHGDTTAPTVSLIDQGYTKGYGCVHSNNTNAVHRTSKSYTFKVVELVDVYVYREIAYAKVNALTNATVKDFDSNVISTTGQKKVSNSNLYAYMWRANGAYVNGNGRLWFTQFFDSTYKGTWTSTQVAAQNSTGSGYWLGDVKITMHVNADSQASDVANPEKLDTAPPISMMRGKELMRYDNAASEMSSSTAYQSNSGDKLSIEQCNNLALHVINAWQNQNNKKYTVNVISDNYVTGASAPPSTNVYQNIIGDVYAVDNGLELFGYGFTAPSETHYRTHFSNYNAKELQDLYLAGAFTLRDITELSRSVLQTGYKGTPSSDSRNKYGSEYTQYYPGMNVSSSFYPVVRTIDQTVTQYFANSTIGASGSISAYKDYATKGGSNLFTGNIETTYGSYPYNNTIVDGDVSTPGVTRYDLVTTGTTAPQTFNGFYNSHYYPNIGSFSSVVRMNYNTLNSYGGITDNGDLNVGVPYSHNGTNVYGASMVVSNIKLKDYAANKAYSNPLGAYVNYNQMTNFYNSTPSSGEALPATIISNLNRYIDPNGYKCTYYNGYTNNLGQVRAINDIIIHDPISVEYAVVAGNGSGDYAPYVTDQTNQDQRTMYNSTADNQKPNYVVMGNSFHFWWSDYGDFQDPNGAWELVNRTDIRGVGSTNPANSDIDGSLIKDATGRSNTVGYSDNMKTTQWIKGRYVSFSFPVQYKDISGNLVDVPANYVFDLSTVPSTDSNGNRVLPTAANQRQVPTGLIDYCEQNPTIDDMPKFGWDFEFTVPTSSFESATGTITIYAEAKNNTGPLVFEQTSETNKDRLNYQALPYVSNVYTIQIVGRIGNLAIEDTSDFRFAELFKKAESSWLIPNVVHNVNLNWPNRIISTPKDIVGDNAALKGHATSSVSAVEFNGNTFLGKAGPYNTFPLVASLNGSYGSSLFRQEQMRLGYIAYMDIDTMGNYYGYNIDSDINGGNVGNFSINSGPKSATDTVDTREYVMTIKPMYVLYDYENGTYHDIDLYYGKQGAYQRYWSSGLGVNDPKASLYVDLPNNMARWNTDLAEKYVTESAFTNNGFLDISAFTGEDYIGTADKIVLDAYNRTFIGSSIRNGAITWNTASGKTRVTTGTFTQSSVFGTPTDWKLPYESYAGVDYGFNEEDYSIQAQRWYFTMGVPSSSYVVPALTVPNNQIAIEKAHNQMKAQHPNSVILCYVSITVKGGIWELEYDYGKANGTTSITLFQDNKDIPDSVKNKSTVAKTINPVGHNGITSKMSPILTMDAWRTSAEDWETYGTH